MSLSSWLSARAADREAAGLTRRLSPRDGSPEIDLAGNDYLGLSRDPRVVEAAVAAVRRWGTGSTGSRLVTGTTGLHLELEERLAAFCRRPAALVFSSGYLANLGAVAALGGPDTLIVSDAHIHASLVDACRLSKSAVAIVPHNDVVAVEVALSDRNQTRALVLAESVYSVLGDAAPLSSLLDVCARLNAVLVVDEAHGLGVVGDGRGSLQAGDDVVVTVTLSKALGAQGGAVLGSVEMRDHLVNTARSFIFETGLTPAAAGAALASIDIVEAEPERVETVRKVADRLAAAVGVEPVAGAVVSVPMPGPREAVAVADACRQRGVRIGAFRPPSVPDGISRLRLTARADLTGADLDRACEVLAIAIEEHR